MENCIFCKISKGEIPSIKIWEDEKYLAFLDVNPVAVGHTLLIPKKHTDYFFDLNDNEYCELMLNAKKIAQLLKSKLNSKRIGMIIEGFAVSHAHVHLIPINKMSEMDPNKAKSAKIEDLKITAEMILK